MYRPSGLVKKSGASVQKNQTVPALVPPAAEGGFLASAKAVFAKFFRRLRGPMQDDYLWPQGTLSEAQWRNLIAFSKRVKKVPAPGASISVRPRSFFGDGETLETGLGEQLVRRNGRYEAELLKESRVDTAPREVLRVRLHLSDGAILDTPVVVYGNARWVDFDKADSQLQDFLQGRVGGIEAIEFVHTHPWYELGVSVGTGGRTRHGELSEGDVLQAIAFAKRVARGRRVIMRAVTPNGYSYEMAFRTG